MRDKLRRKDLNPRLITSKVLFNPNKVESFKDITKMFVKNKANIDVLYFFI